MHLSNKLNGVFGRLANFSRSLSLLVVIALIYLSACSDHEQKIELKTVTIETYSNQPSPIKGSLLEDILPLAVSTFDKIKQACRIQNIAISDFTRSPSEESLNKAKEAWTDCHNQYVTSRLFRALSDELQIYVTPDSESARSESADLETDISHPLQIRIDQFPYIPGYIDSVPGYPVSGLIHDEFDLNTDALMKEHQLGDKAYVAIGFHAIEIMLTAQSPERLDRTQDFLDQENKEEKRLVKRRIKYLNLLNKLLTEDLRQLTNAWMQADSRLLQQLRLVSRERFLTTLTNLISAEFSAISEIRKALNEQPHELIHDNPTTLSNREELAKALQNALNTDPKSQATP